jgi:thioredoxin reductase (NADPH)
VSTTEHDVIVIGSGITGMSACKQLLQDGLSVAIVEPAMFGGLVININELDGSVTGSGAEFASNLMIETSDMGATSIAEEVTGIERDGDGWIVTTTEGSHAARAIIVASGARLKPLGVPGEAEFENRGVGHCADCDGPMYQGKDVVVAGGGDSALQEAVVLSHFCRKVILVNRGAAFTGQQHLVDAVQARANIEVRHGAEVSAILGGDEVERVQVRALADGSSTEVPCSGFFGYVGLEPNSGFLPDFVQRDAAGFVQTDAQLKAAPGGLYAAGAVRAGYQGMLEHAMAEGVTAAKQARDAVAG